MPVTTTFDVKLSYTAIAKALIAGPTKFNKELRKQYSFAGRVAGLKLAALMRAKIRGGIDPANAQMTIDIKGSSKSLVRSGRLFKAVTSESGGTLKTFSIAIGVKRTHKAANIAAILHDGRKQTVTKRQEVFFKALWLASIGRKITLRSDAARDMLAEAKGTIAPIKDGDVGQVEGSSSSN